MSLKKLSLKLSAIALVSLFSFPNSAFAEKPSLLKSGPMLGYSEMREVLLWVQTNSEAKVKIVYWDKNNPENKFQTKEIKTSDKKAFTAKFIADKVLPGKKYTYEVYVNSKKVDRPYPMEFQTQELWQWRKAPPNFKVAFGSCTYINDPEFDRPGKPYGGGEEIFTSIYNKHPDLMIWGGDNVYLREADWYSRTGILYRYTHTRSAEQLQPLLASTHNYAIWDDHDYGPNDSDETFRNKETTLEAFQLFWGNPTYGLKDTQGAFTKFEWGDAEFFLLDDRFYRTPNAKKTGKMTQLGSKQFEWLINSLSSSTATFKIVVMGGQFLNPVVEDYIEDYARFIEEKDNLLATINKENIKGLFFLSGDRHQTELSMLKRDGKYPIYDLTVSPLTAGPYDSSKEPNNLRVAGTIFADRNFSILSFEGTKKDRKMVISIYDKNGKEIWGRIIKSSELK